MGQGAQAAYEDMGWTEVPPKGIKREQARLLTMLMSVLPKPVSTTRSSPGSCRQDVELDSHTKGARVVFVSLPQGSADLLLLPHPRSRSGSLVISFLLLSGRTQLYGMRHGFGAGLAAQP